MTKINLLFLCFVLTVLCACTHHPQNHAPLPLRGYHLGECLQREAEYTLKLQLAHDDRPPFITQYLYFKTYPNNELTSGNHDIHSEDQAVHNRFNLHYESIPMGAHSFEIQFSGYLLTESGDELSLNQTIPVYLKENKAEAHNRIYYSMQWMH